ncbi:MAG: M23 family metallopeptidase [Peptococcia bacterium]
MFNSDKKFWWNRHTTRRRMAKRKKSTHLTMMVVPNGQCEKIKNICIPIWLLKTSLVVFVLCILVVGYFISGFFNLRYVAGENLELKKINTAQAKELRELQDMAGSMRTKLEALVSLDREVRAKVGLEEKSPEVKVPKIDGSRAQFRYQFITMGLTNSNNALGTNANTFEDTGTILEVHDGVDLLALADSPNLEVLASSKELSLSEGDNNPLLELREALAEMDVFMTLQEENINQLSVEVDKQQAKLAATPDYWPYNGRITSNFGWRTNPITKKGKEFHEGIDIAGPYGSAIRAAGNGIVTFAGYKGAWGRLVIVSHGYGYVTYYAHNSSILVKKGDQVEKGQIISRLGNTGRSTGAHLHYGVSYNGKWIDPRTVRKK